MWRSVSKEMVMLVTLGLERWKSFPSKSPGLDLGPLTLLVGPNGAGKSNVIDALRFLQGLSLGYPLGEVFRGRYEGQREVWPGIRGGAAEAARRHETTFAISTGWADSPSARLKTVRFHYVGIDTAGEPALEHESLTHMTASESWKDFDTHASSLRTSAGRAEGDSIRVGIRRTGKGNDVTQTHSAARSLLGQITAEEGVHPDVSSDIAIVREAMRTLAFLDIQPSRMRDYRPKHAATLGTSGENISPVLCGMSASLRADVMGWLEELCAPVIEGIEFDETRLGEVMFFLVERGGAKLSARSVSDGTLRFLGLVTALLTATPGSIIVIEEPDVGLHPSRVHLLAELLEQVSKAGVQVIATTHSATLLASLSRDALGAVIAFARGEDGATVHRRLDQLDGFETLVGSGRLEHLVSTGWLERAL
jgi:predicted ATPase